MNSEIIHYRQNPVE